MIVRPRAYTFFHGTTPYVLISAVTFLLASVCALWPSDVQAQTEKVPAGQSWSQSLIDGATSWSKGAEDTAEAMEVTLGIAKVPGASADFISPAPDTWIVFKTIPGKNPRVGDTSLADAEPSLKDADKGFVSAIKLNSVAEHSVHSYLIVARVGNKWQATLNKNPLEVVVIEHGAQADIYVPMKSFGEILQLPRNLGFPSKLSVNAGQLPEGAEPMLDMFIMHGTPKAGTLQTSSLENYLRSSRRLLQ